jgi:hypothetical protein
MIIFAHGANKCALVTECEMNSDDVLLTSRQVRSRYGNISDMSLWRWLRDERLNFPRPLVLNKRRYWRLRELIAWERARAADRMEAA